MYALHGRGATKPPAPGPSLASLKPTLGLCPVYCTLLLLCAAIAACALFKGVRSLILTEHARSFRNSIMGGGSNVGGVSP